MKFTPTLFVGLTLVFVIGGCAATPEKPMMAEDCTVPVGGSSERAMPDWVCDGTIPDYSFTAVGESEGLNTPQDILKTQAATRAMTQLAQQVRTRVANLIKDYFETTGAYSDDSVERVTQNITETFAEATLVGVKRIKTRSVPINGGEGTRTYVLVGASEESTNQAIQKALEEVDGAKYPGLKKKIAMARHNTSDNERSMRQKFGAAKGHAELEKRRRTN